MHTVTVDTVLYYSRARMKYGSYFSRHFELLKLSSSLTANLGKCAVIMFLIVLWETDNLRFIRLHNGWVIKQFRDKIQTLVHKNKTLKNFLFMNTDNIWFRAFRIFRL